MSDSKTRHTRDLLILRNQSGQLITPAAVAGKIHNFRETTEGTLVSVNGPAPLVPRTRLQENWTFEEYGYKNMMRGIFHASLMEGSREVLLLHTGGKIVAFQGWDAVDTPANTWEVIIGTGAANSDLEYDLPTEDYPGFPTQFEATPTGVVIVPQGFRAVFYDGVKALPLGYDRPPGPPLGLGPTSVTTPNDSGFVVQYQRIGADFSGIRRDFGYARLGTTARALDPVASGGSNTSCSTLLPGEYQCAVQFIDAFGNLSPISGRSATVSFDEQANTAPVNPPSRKQCQVLWSDIEIGRTGTVGRILHRTRDLLNSGTVELFTIPANTGAGIFGAFATIPDNQSQHFLDNTPDSWVLNSATDVMPVPAFSLCRLAFGRLWVANTRDDPGILVPSLPGRYGTFLRDTEMFPDPSGGAITGLWNSPQGLLVFTGSSTFLLTMVSSSGGGFQFTTLNASIGCVAPSSLASLPGGDIIWLGHDGFYIFSGGKTLRISDPIKNLVDRINSIRSGQAVAAYDIHNREYRCWVPLDASTDNNMCLIWNGTGWRERTREKLRGVCVTRDRHAYMIGAGDVKGYGLTGTTQANVETDLSTSNTYSGVWVLDHEVFGFQPVETDSLGTMTRKNIIETCWIEWGSSLQRKTTKTIYLALRESIDSSATIKVYRDWRKIASVYTDTSSATLVSPEDKPPLWGTARWDSEEYWVKRRPYWKRVDIEVASCEVYRIVIETDNKLEFIGMTVDEEPKLGSFGSRVP